MESLFTTITISIAISILSSAALGLRLIDVRFKAFRSALIGNSRSDLFVGNGFSDEQISIKFSSSAIAIRRDIVYLCRENAIERDR